MAEEEMITLVDASPTAAAEGHKRKHGDLEVNSVPELLTEHEHISNPDSVIDALDGDKNGGADESDAKRPRLESNDDNNVKEADGLVSQNGHQDEQKLDEPEPLGKSEKEEAEQVVSVINTSVYVEIQKPVQEPTETFTEEPASNENEKPVDILQAIGQTEAEEEPSLNLGQIKVEVEEPSQNLGRTEAEIEEPSQDLGQTNTGVEEPSQDLRKIQEGVEELSQEAGQTNAGVEEPSHDLGQAKEEVGPSDEVPRKGDVPVASADMESGFDTQILSRKIEVPNDKVGVIIGKAGDTIRSLQDNSGAKIQIMRDADADPRSTTRPLELVGTLKNVNKAEKLIMGVIAEADAGGSPSLIARGFNTVQAVNGGEQVEIQVPFEKVGIIIGKGGETIRNLQTRSGARIQLLQHNLSGGDQSRERTVRMTGNKQQIETAREMIKDVMNQNVRRSPLSGGHGQQGFRPRGPASPQWGHRGPLAQFSSGYSNYPQQRGPYPSQDSQYPPPTYGNYPPQQGPPRSNFGPRWEQRPPPSMHGPSAQGIYNYGQQQGPDYGHQPPYSQPPSQPCAQGGYQHTPSQPYGPMSSQPAPYAQSGYGPQDQYGKPPPTYGMQPQAQQPYVQPRPSHPGEIPYQSQVPSSQPYVQNVPAQQPYLYAPSGGPMQQNYPPPYGAAPPASGYPQGGQPGYSQPVGAQQQQPGVYPQAGPGGGYGSYPTGYAEQPGASTGGYGYQGGQADPAAAYGGGGVQGPAATYPAAAPAGQAASYGQPVQTPASYDPSGAAGYGNVPAGAAATTGGYPQYDSAS